MDYLLLTYLHLATVVPAFLLGTYQLIAPKGGAGHKSLGRVYMILMLVTAVVALFMSASIGPIIFGHFGPIHIFSVVTFYAVPKAYFAAQKKNFTVHRRAMILLYVGALLLAGSFALTPGRLLHQWLFGA